VRRELDQVIRERAFHSVFQPIVALDGGAVLGFEALTRFSDDSPPEVRFVEAAAIGLGPELELATLRAAVEAARLLPAGGFLSLNVSPALVLEGLRFHEVLATADRPLVLEITEHEPIADYAALRAAFARIPVPVEWSIDDAGGGYASLRHILELRPQYVKLDRSLIIDIVVDPARQALVAGMLHFAQALGATLIAEGIESEAERLALQGLGVPAGQGYLLGRPEPPPKR
jgi:EAL domain-containing protein (putative c-di-GMP-specific phosphodiesterase class I)